MLQEPRPCKGPGTVQILSQDIGGLPNLKGLECKAMGRRRLCPIPKSQMSSTIAHILKEPLEQDIHLLGHQCSHFRIARGSAVRVRG